MLLFSVFIKGQACWKLYSRCRDREALFLNEVLCCQMTVCLPPELVPFSVMSCGMSSFLPPPLSNSTTAQHHCLLLSFCVFFSPTTSQNHKISGGSLSVLSALKSYWSELGCVPLGVSCRKQFNH